jgi:hypothetical protein
MATPPPQRAPILCGEMETVSWPFTRCRPISICVQALNLNAGNLAGLRQACGELAAALNRMRQNGAFRRQSRGDTLAAEPAAATQKRKIFRRKNASWQGSAGNGNGNSNAASTGPEQRDEFSRSASPRHRRWRGAIATMQSRVAETLCEIRLLRRALSWGAYAGLTALPRTP